ncbi:hypothetical protein OAC89_05385 [Deltaproteobacteria bacterium]|nr:hypothetical protein [Deltaproteobacteria bacterium]
MSAPWKGVQTRVGNDVSSRRYLFKSSEGHCGEEISLPDYSLSGRA